MNIWLQRVYVLSSIGGGFLGLSITLNSLLSAAGAPPIIFFVSLVFSALYVYGIFAGMRFIEKNDRKHLLAYFWMQVPWISSPILGYRFTSGFDASIAIIGKKITLNSCLGCGWHVNIFQDIPWGIGVNVFALLMAIVLIRARTPAEPLHLTRETAPSS